MAKFKDLIKQHYQNEKLSDDRLEHLQNLVQSPSSSGFNRRPLLAWVAVLMLTVVSSGMYLSQSTSTDAYALLDDVAREIHYNHVKNMQLEMTSADTAKLFAYFDRLDFRPMMPQMLTNKRWQLVGGRYCSLAGRLALQLKVMDAESGERFTAYQAMIPKSFKEQPELDLSHQVVAVAGEMVTMWSEGDLMFAVAGPQAVARDFSPARRVE